MNSGKIGKIRALQGLSNETSQGQQRKAAGRQVSADAVRVSLSSSIQPEQKSTEKSQTVTQTRKKPDINEDEARDLAEKIGRTLKYSADAFGSGATLFHNIDGQRSRDLLR